MKIQLPQISIIIRSSSIRSNWIKKTKHSIFNSYYELITKAKHNI